MSNFSIKNPYTVFVGVILVIILGVVSFMNLSTDLLPSMELPYVAVITTYPGASPERIEETVSKPIEQSIMGVSGIKNIQSRSQENVSMVICEFEGDTDMNAVMIETNQKIEQVKSYLEDGVSAPIIMQLNPNMLPVLMTAVDKENTDITELTDFVDENIVPELEGVEGVASVDLMGAVQNEIKIHIDQSKIDDINDKVLKKVSNELYKAKKEITDAETKLNEGKEEVTKQKEENTKKIADGLAQVETGRNELTKAEIELGNKEKEVVAAKTDLESKLKQIEEVEAQKAGIVQAIGLYDQKDGVDAQIPGVEAEITTLETEIASGTLTPEEQAEKEASLVEKQTTLATLQGTSAQLGAAIGGIGKTKLELQEALNTINQTIPAPDQAKEQLLQGLAQVNTGYNALLDGKKQLNDKKTELNNAYSMLEVAQSTLANEITKAEVKLDTAEAQLKTGKEQFESAREQAYKQASLDGVITADLISNILMAENFEMPAGYIEEDMIIKIGEKFASLEEIQNLVLFSFDIKGLEEVKLSDVANIEATNNQDDIYTKINKNAGLVLSFNKQSTASTKDVSEAVQDKMRSLEEKYEGLSFTNVMDQGIYIDMIIGSVMQSLIAGGLLAIVILFLFLKEIRPTIIVAISIPISLVFAVTLMYFTGVGINIMSLSGLALGVGMLVDNSIVVIENIFRLKKEGKDITDAAEEGARKVTGAIIASTLTTVCVFLPIVFVHGLSRQLFTDIGLTIAYSLLASLIVALTVVPAFAVKILKKVNDKENHLINFITKGYTKLLRLALKCKILVLAIIVGLFVFSLYLMTIMEIEFVPEVSSEEMEYSFTMNNENATTDETHQMSDTIIDRILSIEDVYKVGAIDMGSSGTISIMGGASGGISGYILLNEDKTHTNQEIAEIIKEKTADLDVEMNVSASTMDMSAMMESGVSIRITGKEIPELKDIGRKVEEKLKSIDGIGEVTGVDSSTKSIEKLVKVDKNKAMKYGLTVAQVFQRISGDLKTEVEGTKVEIDKKDYKILIEKPVEDKLTLDNILDMEFEVKENNKDKTIKLSDIATISDEEALDTIARLNNNRYITVSAKIADGASSTQTSRAVSDAFKDFETPEGYKVEVEGEMDDIMGYIRDLLLMILVAVMFIYLIMVAQFQSFKLPFIVMFTIPLAFTGGILGLYLTGQAISIIAMLGFLVLAGVVVNNGIVFIDSINQLRQEGMERKEAIILTGSLRLRPILMTALTTILGMLAMALGIGEGSEMSKPLGIVTIGGLMYSTLLTLFLCPVLYDILCKRTVIGNATKTDSLEENQIKIEEVIEDKKSKKESKKDKKDKKDKKESKAKAKDDKKKKDSKKEKKVKQPKEEKKTKNESKKKNK